VQLGYQLCVNDYTHLLVMAQMIRYLRPGCADSWPVHDVYLFTDASHHTGVAICDHDFIRAIDRIPSDPDGWQGFLLHYHCCDDPWDDAPWEIVDLAMFINHLEIGTRALVAETGNEPELSMLLGFLRDAHAAGARIFVKRE
jgi:hypothetical protein